MAKIWRIVVWAALGLLIAGIVLGGAGWLTGASLTRMADILYGGADGAKAAAQTVLEQGSEVLRSVLGIFG